MHRLTLNLLKYRHHISSKCSISSIWKNLNYSSFVAGITALLTGILLWSAIMIAPIPMSAGIALFLSYNRQIMYQRW
jgi:fatty acid desaturase